MTFFFSLKMKGIPLINWSLLALGLYAKINRKGTLMTGTCTRTSIPRLARYSPILEKRLCDMRATVLVCASPRRNTCWKPNGSPGVGLIAALSLKAASSSLVVTNLVSRSTSPGTPNWLLTSARSVLALQAAKVDKLVAAMPFGDLSQRKNPTELKKG